MKTTRNPEQNINVDITFDSDGPVVVRVMDNNISEELGENITATPFYEGLGIQKFFH